MKEEIKTEDIKYFKRNGIIFNILFFSASLSAFPLMLWPMLAFGLSIYSYIGIGAWGVIIGMAAFYGFRIEKLKKKFDIQSYKEIVAFYEGKTLSEIDKHREYGKRPYQKVFLVIGFSLLSLAFFLLMFFIYCMFRGGL